MFLITVENVHDIPSRYSAASVSFQRGAAKGESSKDDALLSRLGLQSGRLEKQPMPRHSIKVPAGAVRRGGGRGVL